MAEPQSEAPAHLTFDVDANQRTTRRNSASAFHRASPSSIASSRTAVTVSAPSSRTSSRTSSASRRSEIIRRLTVPPKPVGTAPPFWQGLKAIVLMSWLNVLLVFIPASWACRFALPKSDKNDTLTFAFSFLAIIPLGKMLVFATDELSMRVGQTLAGLLAATLGNTIELIVAIIALVRCQLQVVQASLVGSILSNLLLVLGMCFFAGGTRFSEQGFGMSLSRLNSSLLTVSVIAVLLPAAFHTTTGGQIPDSQEAKDILAVSHGAAIVLLFIYLSYLVFQLFSHKDLYDDHRPDIFKSTKYSKKGQETETASAPAANSEAGLNASADPLARSVTGSPPATPWPGDPQLPDTNSALQPEYEEEEEEIPQMSVGLTIALIVVVTVVVAVTTVGLVDSIDGLTSSRNISKPFVGLILPLIAGNAAEHITAVSNSVKDKLTLSLCVAVGSSIQLALFVIPFVVTLGWIIGKPLSLLFDPFESIVLFLSVLVVNYVMQDGKTDWLEGVILMCLYVIIAVTFWYYPGPVNELLSC